MRRHTRMSQLHLIAAMICFADLTYGSEPGVLEDILFPNKKSISTKENMCNFWLPRDIQKIIFGMLDIKSMARLEQTSRSIQLLVTQLKYTHMEAYELIAETQHLPKDVFQCLHAPYFSWADLKRTRISHKEFIPWTSRFLLKNIRVELGIIYSLMTNKDTVNTRFGKPSDQDLALLNKTARVLNDTLILMGLKKAYYKKQCGLNFDHRGRQGFWGYPLDSKEYDRFKQVIVTKSMSNGIERYTLRTKPLSDPKTDQTVVEHLPNVKENLHLRLHHIFEAQSDSPTSRFFIEQYVEQRNKTAIRFKLNGLSLGMYGYAQSNEEIRVFLDLLVEEGNRFAIKNKIIAWAGGVWGYDADLLGAFELSRRWLVHFY